MFYDIIIVEKSKGDKTIMGWSSAGNIVSEQTISLYNANKLDKEALETIIKP